jgi:hypothetical protein
MSDSEDKNIAFFLRRRDEYTNFLSDILTPYIYEGLSSMYFRAAQICDKNNNNDNCLITFQKLLRRIPEWNQSHIEKEMIRIKSKSNTTEYFDDLVKAVISSNIILLTHSGTISNNISQSFLNNLDISLFVHMCYVEAGKDAFNQSYLFYHDVHLIYYKAHVSVIIGLIEKAIPRAIRKILPIKQILQEYQINSLALHKENVLPNVELLGAGNPNGLVVNPSGFLNIPGLNTGLLNTVPTNQFIAPGFVNQSSNDAIRIEPTMGTLNENFGGASASASANAMSRPPYGAQDLAQLGIAHGSTLSEKNPIDQNLLKQFNNIVASETDKNKIKEIINFNAGQEYYSEKKRGGKITSTSIHPSSAHSLNPIFNNSAKKSDIGNKIMKADFDDATTIISESGSSQSSKSSKSSKSSQRSRSSRSGSSESKSGSSASHNENISETSELQFDKSKVIETYGSSGKKTVFKKTINPFK